MQRNVARQLKDTVTEKRLCLQVSVGKTRAAHNNRDGRGDHGSVSGGIAWAPTKAEALPQTLSASIQILHTITVKLLQVFDQLDGSEVPSVLIYLGRDARAGSVSESMGRHV